MLRPRRCIGDGRGTPAMPIGPFVTGIQFTIMTFTRTQKKAVVMASTWPLSRRTSFPIAHDTSAAAAPETQKVPQKGMPNFVLRMAET